MIFKVLFLFFGTSGWAEGGMILVDKGERKLMVFSKDRVVASYEVGLGLESLLPKERRGDFLTPEGVYSIVEIRTSSSYRYFVKINYPNLNDLGFAYYRGVLSREEFKRLSEEFIRENYVKVDLLGGNVGIHGGGSYRLERGKKDYHWTQGCVALKDRDLEKLLPNLYLGQKVILLNSKKGLYEFLKKLVYPISIKPLEFFEGEVYLKLEEEIFIIFNLKEYHQGRKILKIKEYHKGELVSFLESDEAGRVEQEERFKKLLLENIFNLLKPYKNIEF